MPSILVPPHHSLLLTWCKTRGVETLRGSVCGSVISCPSALTRRRIHHSDPACSCANIRAATCRVEGPYTTSNSVSQRRSAVLDLMGSHCALVLHEPSCIYSHAFRENIWSANPTLRGVTSAEDQTSHASHETSNTDQMRCIHSLPARIRASLMAKK